MKDKKDAAKKPRIKKAAKKTSAKKPRLKTAAKKTVLKKSAAAKPAGAKSAAKKKKAAPRKKAKTSIKKSAGKKKAGVKTAKKSARAVKSGAKKPGRPAAKITKPRTLKKDGQAVKRRKTSVPHVPYVSGVSDDLEAKFVLGLPEIIDEYREDAPRDLPDSYGDHRLVLIARDPRWVFCYWETDPAKREEGLRKLGKSPEQTRWILRVYSLPADKKGARTIFADLGVDFSSSKTYLELFPSGAAFSAELGLMDQQGNFAAIVESNIIELPPDKPSENFDERWTLGENIQKAFYESMGGHMGNQGLSADGRSMPSFGVSSSSKYEDTKN